MSKSKESIKKVVKKTGKYVREISVVVIGVTITLSVSHWISIKNEKRDMALNLRAITMECQENAKDMGVLIESLIPANRYSVYLQSHDKNSLNKDTINSYYSLFYSTPRNFTFKTNAFEMFKNSGTMRLLDDKVLLMEIWNVYDGFNYLKEIIDEHNKQKWNFIEKEISLVDIIPMYDFYKKTGITNRLLDISERLLNNTKELVIKLMLEQLKTSTLKTYKVTDEDLNKYTGIYSNDQLPVKLSITKYNKFLLVQLPGKIPYPFYATAKNKFEYEDAIFEFNLTDKTIVVNRRGEIFTFVREE